MNSSAVDVTNLIPGLSGPESACFVALVLLVVCPAGHAIRSLAGLDVADRIQRWSLVGILGVFWISIAYFALGIVGRLDWHPVIVWLPVVLWFLLSHSCCSLREQNAGSRSEPRHPLIPRSLIVGVALVGLFVAGYLGQVAGLVEYDRRGLELHGAFFSDKLAGTGSCAALMHEVPPRSLNFAGQTSFTHYFPRVFVAAFCRVTSIDFVSGFWFHAAALGIALEGLAILAFCRRLFGSYWFGCLALVLHGLFRYTAEQKPLDLSFAMLLMGLLAVDRCHTSGRARWGILAVCLFGAMPTYEVFHAVTTAAGLLVWWAVGVIKIIPWKRSPRLQQPAENADGPGSPLKQSICDNSGATAGLSSSAEREPPQNTAGQAGSGTLFQRAASQDRSPAAAWREARFRTLIVWPACLLAFAAIRILSLGAEVTSPPEVISRNSYRDSYKHEWQDLLRESSQQHPVLATIYHWKRGKPFNSTDHRRSTPPEKPGALKRLAGKVAYEVGFAGYFLIRFLNVAVFGCLALWLWFRRGTWPTVTVCGAAASIGLVGIAVPLLATFGHYADDQWWETPNIYRFNTLACMLLVLLGCQVMADAARQWRRPLSWVAGSVVVARVAYLLIGMAAPALQFTLVDHDRLEALAFLRAEVPFGQIVLHPWTDDLIRDTRRPDQISWIYQDHFMLGANLAGQQMYFEGKPDHAFSTGRVPPEEVYRRRRLRGEFYQPGHAAAVDELIGPAGVSWVVSDAEHKPPPQVADHWEQAFTNATVSVFRKPK